MFASYKRVIGKISLTTFCTLAIKSALNQEFSDYVPFHDTQTYLSPMS